MAVTQYIGARYVPRFYEGSSGSEWDANVTYEPLTIVTYLGSSWTSKKAVPASVGAPNLNPTYWVNTGNFNHQLDQVLQIMSGLQEDVTGNTADIEELEEAAGHIQRDISTQIAGTVLPIYMGDFVSYGYFLSCALLVDGAMLCFCPVSRQDATIRSNAGKVRKYTFSNGAFIGEYDMNIGHAQSACYNDDDGYIYLVPLWDYSGVSDLRDRNMYKINPSNLSIVDTIAASFDIRNVTFDSAQHKMYVMDDSQNVYEYTSGTFSYKFTVNNAFELPEIIQDFAMHDHMLYLTSTLNRCIKAYWNGTADSLEPENVFTLSPFDSLDRWRLGELEGIEFDTDGHLIGSTFTTISPSDTIEGHGYSMTNNIVVELPLNDTAPYPLRGQRILPDNRSIAIDQSYTTFWASSNATIRDFYQIMALNRTYHSAYLAADYVTSMNGAANLHIPLQTYFNMNNHKLKTNRIELLAELSLYGTGTLTSTKDGTTNGIFYFNTRGGGGLELGNNLTLTVECAGESSRENNFVNPGSTGQEIWDGATITSDLTLYIGSHEHTAGKLYRGNRIINA